MNKKSKFETAEVRKMRDALPRLTIAEIRRYRIPYHEAILAELEEAGYVTSADFIAQLLQYQEDYRNEHSYDVIIQSRPVLIECKEELDRLYTTLQQAEAAHFRGDIATELDELLKLAYQYAFGPVDWWWLAEQFFAQCISISERYTEDEQYRQTVTYYIYGKYLIEQAKVMMLGMQFLNAARELSAGKEWTASKVSGVLEKYVFVEVCRVLYNTLMEQVRATIKYDAALALELCLEARQRGIDACLPRADVFYMQGQCELAIGQADKAVGSFMKAFLLYKTNKQLEQCCDAMICLAQAFQELASWNQMKEQLEKLLAFAQKENLTGYVGQAYLYMGQYFLNAGTPELASPYLTNALNIFHEINDVPHREFVKNLGAVSKGQETFASYVKLILRCEDTRVPAKRGRNLERLLHWKDARTPFWDDMTESSTENVSEMGEWELEEEVEEEASLNRVMEEYSEEEEATHSIFKEQ